jgi:formylglycine-generating enzyme
MKTRQLLTLVAAAFGVLVTPPASALITIDTAWVGDAGNANDTTGYGGVGYSYGIGKYEVTLDQYTTFLNAVATSDTYSLYNANMAANANIAGIARSGSAGSYTYSVIGSGNRPVTYVSWFDAARFCNWLENGQPTGAQNASTTEQGTYTLNGAMSGLTFAKTPGAVYGLPNENEWYKAAYYQPAAEGGPASGYWRYPTRSNTQPNSRNGSATDPNSANYYYDDGLANGYNGGYAVNNSTTLPTGNALTDVGAFSLADSFYGTFDQGGNVWEWNDAVISTSRGLRGGSWFSGETDLATSARFSSTPSSERNIVGFRIVIPEPTGVGLMALGIALLAWRQKRSL